MKRGRGELFQLKERHAPAATTVEAEEKWFQSKVLTQATRQVRDTLTYLDGHSVEIRNHRGHLFTLDIGSIQPLHKLIVYLPHEKLPESRRNLKYHRSKTAGLIHIIPAN